MKSAGGLIIKLQRNGLALFDPLHRFKPLLKTNPMDLFNQWRTLVSNIFLKTMGI